VLLFHESTENKKKETKIWQLGFFLACTARQVAANIGYQD